MKIMKYNYDEILRLWKSLELLHDSGTCIWYLVLVNYNILKPIIKGLNMEVESDVQVDLVQMPLNPNFLHETHVASIAEPILKHLIKHDEKRTN